MLNYQISMHFRGIIQVQRIIHPLREAVIDALVKYSEEMKEEIEFINTDMPSLFLLECKKGKLHSVGLKKL